MDTINTPVHPAGRLTAADIIAQMIHTRVPHWPVRIENLSWIAYDPDPLERRAVVVATGQIGRINDQPDGPTLIGTRHLVEARIILPSWIPDPETVVGVLDALTAMGILPARSSAVTTAGAVPPIGRGAAGNSATLQRNFPLAQPFASKKETA